MTRYDSADGLSGLSPNLRPQMTMARPALSSRVPEEAPVRGRRGVFAGSFQQMAWAAAGATSASVRPVSPPSSHAASPSRRFGTRFGTRQRMGGRDPPTAPSLGSSALRSLVLPCQGARGGGWFLFLGWALIPGKDLVSSSSSTVLQPPTLHAEVPKGLPEQGLSSCCRPGRELAPAASRLPRVPSPSSLSLALL